MNTINPNIFPKGGFQFLESDGTRIIGKSWNGVVSRVVNYRKRAGLPPGNPEDEVVAQACQQNPVLCRQDNGVREAQVKRSSLKVRVLLWLSVLRGKRDKEPLEFVPEGDSRNRTLVCVGCPKNIEIGDGCSSCKAALAESRKDLLGGRRSDKRLNSCLVLGEDTHVSIWLESQSVIDGDLPGHCWRRRA